MPTALPPSTDFTAASNQAGAKGFVTSLRAFLSGLLGTTGSTAAARIALELEATRADIASAATLDLDSTTTHSLRVTGTTATTAMTLADGAYRKMVAAAAWPITNGANLVVQGNADYTCVAGDIVHAFGEPAGVVRLAIWKADGTPVVSATTSTQIQPISASVGSNALTISASALSLDFRSATLGSGTVTRVSGSPSNLVISSGSTLGTFSGIQSRIAVLAINNAGSIELAAVNVAGGQYLTETGLISTTAEGGAGAADSATVVYSTTARSNVAYRVLGYVESTQATAGTWASAPSTIQGAGGFAMVSRGMVSGLAVATTSGTSVDVTGIGAGAKRIQINLNAVSTNGTSTPLLQIGDSGGVETSGYVSAAQNNGGSYTTSTAGMLLTSSAAATDSTSGTITLSLVDASAQTWVCSAVLNKSSVSTVIAGGVKSLSPGPLDRIRLTTSGGTDTFDAGSLNVMVEY